MIYDHTNCDRKCLIADAAGAELREVVSIDTGARTVVRASLPVRCGEDDEIVTFTRTFERADIVCDQFGQATSIALYGLQP